MTRDEARIFVKARRATEELRGLVDLKKDEIASVQADEAREAAEHHKAGVEAEIRDGEKRTFS